MPAVVRVHIGRLDDCLQSIVEWATPTLCSDAPLSNEGWLGGVGCTAQRMRARWASRPTRSLDDGIEQHGRRGMAAAVAGTLGITPDVLGKPEGTAVALLAAGVPCKGCRQPSTGCALRRGT